MAEQEQKLSKQTSDLAEKLQRLAGKDKRLGHNAGQKATLFQGETLRGLLLYGYAFATMGTIAGYAAVAAFVGALVLLILVFLGFRHARKAGAAEPPPTS